MNDAALSGRQGPTAVHRPKPRPSRGAFEHPGRSSPRTGAQRSRKATQNALPQTRVVKTLNTVGGPIGVEPSFFSAPMNVFLSGDDQTAKATVSGLLADLGWEADQQIDLGGIATARAVEHYFLLFVALIGALGTPEFNIAITH